MGPLLRLQIQVVALSRTVRSAGVGSGLDQRELQSEPVFFPLWAQNAGVHVPQQKRGPHIEARLIEALRVSRPSHGERDRAA